jgi:hypothetical protein
MTRLLVDESTLDDGSVQRTWMESREGVLCLRFGDEDTREVSPPVLEAVMKRYAKPLATEIEVIGPSLALEGGASLTLLRHRARYDVIAKDYLVYAVPGREPVAELATSVTAALSWLIRR